MAAFTAGEIANIANAALDFYIKGDAFAQTIQDRPLLRTLMAKQKSFPGGKGDIRQNVVAAYTTAIEGYEATDTVTYATPTNIVQTNFPWKEIHAGISMTLSELKVDGISVVDSLDGKSTSKHSGRDTTVITGLLENKLQDMGEGWSRTFNEMLWKDGTLAAKEVPGIQFLVSETPALGTVGGVDRATNTWWRNRTLATITHSAANQTLTEALKKEVRQLRRYGGRPDLILCGSDFMAAIEEEVLAKSSYTDSNAKSVDISSQNISIRGIGTFQYDPTLDDLSKAKYCYILDSSNINLMVMEGEDRKQHNPARPHNQYVLYRAMTWTGGLCAKKLNGCGVYDVT